MKMKSLLITLSFCCLTFAQQDSEAGDAQSTTPVRATGVRYLHPDDFKNVPARVRSKLNEAHCLIPQVNEKAIPHNVVTGQFARRGQQDWAAYCSVHGKSKVLVVWGGPSQCSGNPFNDGAPERDSTVSGDLDDSVENQPRGSFWTLSAIRHSEVRARLKVMKSSDELFKSATHDALERSAPIGGNTVDCNDGHWRELWYAD